MTFRKLGRNPAHRKSLLRNLVTSLIEHESITTTHAKAKEAQVAAERLISLAKNKSPDQKSAKTRALQYIFKPTQILPKLFGDLAARYEGRTGGYTRVLRLENRIGDNAPQSILELVDGERDMRRAITARVVARLESQGLPLDPTTQKAVDALCTTDKARARFEQEVDTMRAAFIDTASAEELELKPTPRTHRQRAPIRILENPLRAQ